MRLSLGADHAGFELKDLLAAHARALGHEIIDHGPHASESVDYPDFAGKVAHDVAEGRADRGLLVCGSGQGMAMAANKVPGVRAACVSDPVSASLVIQHNDARVLTLGARIIGVELAKACFDAWLEATFEGGRHQRRVGKIEALAPGRG